MLASLVRLARSLRVRIALVTALAVVVPLVIGVFVLATLLQHSLTGSLVGRVSDQAAGVANAVQRQGPTEAAVSNVDPSLRAVVLDRTGAVVASSAPGDQAPLSADRPRPNTSSVRGERRWYRPGDVETPLIVSQGVRSGGRDFVIQVSSSQQAQHEAISTDVKILLLGTPVLTVLAALLAWWVSGLALAPVQRMRREVDEIEARSLDTRVEVPRQQDEIAALATTLNRMLDRLEHAQGEQRRFVADASHELRSPLATLQAAVELATDDDEWRQVAPTVRDEIGRMTGLVNDLLLLAQLDERPATGTEEVDLDDIAQAEVQRWRGDSTIQVRYVGSPARGRGRQRAVERIARNLVDNAVRHARSEVVVSTTTGRDGAAVLTVDDDGPGIPAADRGRVFDRFVRLDSSRSRGQGGFGLGLAIVRDLARSSGGDVVVAESPSGGARFVVTLPGQVGDDAAVEGQAGRGQAGASSSR
ncbi:sensor histidine kinase [Flexivirga meconopsidis]|uniref:sensor histidine kinase n=1 Tax=Flexivirga meconopsidis TaxID=2977121 RepID=UPI00223E95AF